MLYRATKEPDAVARGVLESDGPIAKAAWGCPVGTNREPSREGLDETHVESLDAVERLTGVRCDTCPNFYARLPWVSDAVVARRWRDKGQLQLRTEHPSAALVAAIDAIDRGDNARQVDDYERRERDREAAADEAKRAREHGR
jgi:hypothetical protein